MPTYDYECQSCEHHFELVMRISDYDTSHKPACPECSSGNTTRVFTTPMVIFSGDGWGTKNDRIAGQMKKKNERLAGKERDMKGDGMVPQLAPNVDGERTDSWSDAAKLAKSKGKDTSGYEQRARKEKASSV